LERGREREIDMEKGIDVGEWKGDTWEEWESHSSHVSPFHVIYLCFY
jgi:hypothetical protein